MLTSYNGGIDDPGAEHGEPDITDKEGFTSYGDDDGDDGNSTPKTKRIKVKLADGKERTIQHTVQTSFWHPDGKPMSPQQFMEALFGFLPQFFASEHELRDLWSKPDTREYLLKQLSDEGFGREQLAEMQRIIDAEDSDLFDVLAYVAYALPKMSRSERAEQASTDVEVNYTDHRKEFLDFVLSHYVTEGVEELGNDKLTPLLRLKYHNAISDAVAELGNPDEIRKMFVDFQQYLYTPGVGS